MAFALMAWFGDWVLPHVKEFTTKELPEILVLCGRALQNAPIPNTVAGWARLSRCEDRPISIIRFQLGGTARNDFGKDNWDRP